MCGAKAKNGGKAKKNAFWLKKRLQAADLFFIIFLCVGFFAASRALNFVFKALMMHETLA